jgi:hypothetical protein
MAMERPGSSTRTATRPSNSSAGFNKTCKGLIMKTKVALTAIVAAGLAWTSASLRAHHGDAGRYEDKLTTVKGTVVELQLINPHAIVLLDVDATRDRRSAGFPRRSTTRIIATSPESRCRFDGPSSGWTGRTPFS